MRIFLTINRPMIIIWDSSEKKERIFSVHKKSKQWEKEKQLKICQVKDFPCEPFGGLYFRQADRDEQCRSRMKQINRKERNPNFKQKTSHFSGFCLFTTMGIGTKRPDVQRMKKMQFLSRFGHRNLQFFIDRQSLWRKVITSPSYIEVFEPAEWR